MIDFGCLADHGARTPPRSIVVSTAISSRSCTITLPSCVYPWRARCAVAALSQAVPVDVGLRRATIPSCSISACTIEAFVLDPAIAADLHVRTDHHVRAEHRAATDRRLAARSPRTDRCADPFFAIRRSDCPAASGVTPATSPEDTTAGATSRDAGARHGDRRRASDSSASASTDLGRRTGRELLRRQAGGGTRFAESAAELVGSRYVRSDGRARRSEATSVIPMRSRCAAPCGSAPAIATISPSVMRPAA